MTIVAADVTATPESMAMLEPVATVTAPTRLTGVPARMRMVSPVLREKGWTVPSGRMVPRRMVEATGEKNIAPRKSAKVKLAEVRLAEARLVDVKLALERLARRRLTEVIFWLEKSHAERLQEWKRMAVRSWDW